MPKEPVDLPGTDEVTDGTDEEARSVTARIEKIGGTGDKRPSPPPPEDIPDDEVRSPMVMP